MNPEKMMDAISEISDKYVEKYAVVEPVRHDSLNLIVIQRKWVYRLCACLAALTIAIGIGIPVLNHLNIFSQNEDLPLLNDTTLISSVNVSSYVYSYTGMVTEQQLSISVETPVSIMESADHLKGLLFSVDSASQDVSPTITILTASTCEQKPCELFKLPGVEFVQGKLYFFFVGENIEDYEDLAFYYFDEKTTASFEVLIEVSESNSGYSAKLTSISSSFPEQEP